MRSILANLRSLTLPAGVTTGRRIFLDGVNGLIALYDAANALRIQIGGTGVNEDRITFYSADPDESAPGFIEAQGGVRVTLAIAGPEVTAQADRAHIDLSSPVNDPGLDRARIDIYGDVGPIDLALDLATFDLSSGANHPIGEATLVAGTVVVPNTTVTAGSLIFLSRRVIGAAPGNLTYVRTAGVSFTINSDNAGDTGTISYFIIT